MLTVTIEYFVKPGREEEYSELAEKVFPEVDKIDGFISVEGFESLIEPGKNLSLSFWRDEESIQRWRDHPEHAKVMQQARDRVFSSYRITVSSSMRDYRFRSDDTQ
ncbi:MAG TPA: antibiotic biosynthesis monooxygenase [Arenicellales bacterium]|jgi:heme-degrading monooxygenase HmoA|nr:antibiotic biosynthesis monooxygenase [Arenicellales bacterium]|tara:strand:+ start:451 stop:768 length:318 start_codon:yes stop_codon:yes gene_type:complete